MIKTLPPKPKSPPDWRKKFAKSVYEKVEVLNGNWGGGKAGERMYISSPKTIAAFVARVPVGATKSIPELRIELAKAHEADMTCPLTTSIFLRIAAEVSLLDMAEGKSSAEVTPFWRVIDLKSPIAKKLSCGIDGLKHLQDLEQGN